MSSSMKPIIPFPPESVDRGLPRYDAEVTEISVS